MKAVNDDAPAVRPLLWAAVLAFGLHAAGRAQESVAEPSADPQPAKPKPVEPDPAKLARVRPLSPVEARAAIRVPPGYRLELVAHEPMVEEPTVVAWDGNGRMYVAEMRTYMQDIDGTDQLQPTSRISRLEDTDGDGVMDEHTVFVDGLVLPRMITTLEDSILVRETGTLDLWEYRDTDGDGVADDKHKVYEGGPRGGNLEHQPSGLDWNLDNYLYVTYTAARYRYRDGRVEAHPLPAGDGQWGVTHDDEGQVFYSRAGGEVPATSFQQNLQYGRLDLPGQYADGFVEVWPIDDIPDVQGGRGRVRDDHTLNHFTACCGQSIFRGDRLPADLYGDLLIPEPVGRLVRRAEVEVHDGVRVLRNAHEGSEFMASTDANFRPVNSYTGPDGTLYLVDMYRGIIQEGNWVREGSYLRGVVQEFGLDRNIGRGRIYRLVHEDFAPGPQPRMLDETAAQLVAHLAHPNGWWRDTAQKLLVLRGDRAVVPQLNRMVAGGAPPIARLHALWTLEGMAALTRARLLATLADPDPRLRAAAVRICERDLDGAQSDPTVVAALRRVACEDPEPHVARQLLRTVLYEAVPEHDALAEQIAARHPEDQGMRVALERHRARREAARVEAERLAAIERENVALAAAVRRGESAYRMLCASCHGAEGRGASPPGDAAVALGPSLVASPRVLGSVDRLGRILLHGITGPIDGATYPGVMAPMGSFDDPWIADVLSYVRNSWGNDAGRVTAAEVAAVRASAGGRATPWTEVELRRFDPALQARTRWRLQASRNQGQLRHLVDGDPASRWGTGRAMRPGAWLQIELPYAVEIEALSMDAAGSRMDFPRAFDVHTSLDGVQWSEAVGAGEGRDGAPLVRFSAPVEARFVRITQTGSHDANHWSIHELQIYGADHPIPGG